MPEEEKPKREDEGETDPDYIKKVLKISGVNIDHISETATGPVSWLTRGTIDLRLELLLPRIDFEDQLNQAGTPLFNFSRSSQNKGTSNVEGVAQQPPSRDIKMKYEVVLQNLSAEVPLSTPHLSYLRSALIQPIVIYLNTNYTVFPVNFSFSIPQSRFKNAWYPGTYLSSSFLLLLLFSLLSSLVSSPSSPLLLPLLLFSHLLTCLFLGDVGYWDAISEASGMAIVDIVKEKRNSKNLWEMLYYGGDGLVRGVRYCWLYIVKSFFALPPSLN